MYPLMFINKQGNKNKRNEKDQRPWLKLTKRQEENMNLLFHNLQANLRAKTKPREKKQTNTCAS